MNKEKFTIMSESERNETYGGFAWLLVAVPLLFQAITTVVGAVKAFTSPNGGSIKTTAKGVETHWDAPKATKAPKATSSNKKTTSHSKTYYAY